MMYQSKLAFAIKVNGKVLREGKSQGSETDDTVFIPFGSEYTLYVKNMNSVRALVRFEIDGVNATEGVSIIVPANGHIELERFITSGNYDQGLRFKFIERTKKIEDGPRGIKVEDGLIRVEYEFEREPAKVINPPIVTYPRPMPSLPREVHHHHYRSPLNDWADRQLLGSPVRSYSANATSTVSSINELHSGEATTDAPSAFACSAAAFDSEQFAAPQASGASMDWMDREMERSISAPVLQSSASRAKSPQASRKLSKSYEENEKGITVGGSVSEQKFDHGSWFPTDGVKHVMVIKILGETGNGKVEKPVTVKTKQECPTCGTLNKFGTKFCRECGTGLVKV